MKLLIILQLKNMVNTSQQISPRREEPAEDAMFQKKPLTGYFCASCEKDVVNLSQKPAEYHNWNKLPFRNPGERIAKVG